MRLFRSFRLWLVKVSGGVNAKQDAGTAQPLEKTKPMILDLKAQIEVAISPKSDE